MHIGYYNMFFFDSLYMLFVYHLGYIMVCNSSPLQDLVTELYKYEVECYNNPDNGKYMCQWECIPYNCLSW